TAALLMGIPIAHLHGGELTEGAVDDAIRHAITKMAALHFAAAEPYARRIVQMGEEPARVHVVGAPGLDNLVDVAGLSRAGLAAELKLDLDHDGGGRLFVVTYHPVTQAVDHGRAGAAAMTQALATHPDATVLITGVNSDAGHGAIHAALSAFAAAEPRRRRLTASLGRRLYLGALKHADAVIGNSSSGLVEAPALNTPTVNIGDRQKGRLRAASVIDCAEDAGSISAAIAQALDPTFRAGAAHVAPPYGRGGAATRIAAILADCDPAQLSRKRFHDIIGA
ncbi:MAG: UDP-N-acetylglucosamine 2-epimerase, partial [Rhodospirillaceae bacterium]|nr:UDP-N-acetylglucosamine 2-epimerase [Rhodospirillaceae bacterium]